MSSKLDSIVIFGYTGDGSDYAEEELAFTLENGVATATVTADQAAKYANCTTFGYDVYFMVKADSAENKHYVSIKSTPGYDSAADAEFVPGEAIAMGEGEWVSYVAASYEERTVILGILEKYAVDNFLTGLTIYGNGGYVMYDERVNPGTGDWTNYIPGYGFGVLAEGDLLG